MSYIVSCDCGNCLAVEPAMAGSPVACECGRTVAVPSLSKLRELTGASPYETGVVFAIRRMIEHGRLPSGDVCALTGRPTGDVLDLLVVVSDECRPTGRGVPSGAARAFLRFGFPGLIVAWVRAETGDFEPVPGTETVIHTPVRLDERHHRRARKMTSERLKELLRKTPIYAKLLQDYPYASASVAEPSGQG